MKYEFFKIGETEIKTVTAVEISKTARQRTENTNLNGDLLIDQMAIKSTITVSIDIVPDATMAVIENAVVAGLVDITYYDGAVQKTISATCSETERPRPFYKYGDRQQGVYYNNIRLEFRER